MMMKYPDKLKRDALNLAARLGIKVAQMECDLGITPGTDLQVAAAVSD